MGISKRGAQAAQTKDNIIRVALGLFRDYGYQNVSIRQLCREAGISTGAFYHHFSSKDEMINAGFALYDENLEVLLAEYEYSDPLEDIRFILLHQTRFVMENTAHLTKELYIAELTTTSEKYLVKPQRRYYRTVRELVKKARAGGRIASDLSDDEITEFLLRINRGVILDWCFKDYAYDLLEQAEKDLDFAIRGLVSAE